MSRNYTLNPLVLGGQVGQFYAGLVSGGSAINANNSNGLSLYANNLNIFSGNVADTSSWTDAVTTTTFQVGVSSGNVAFTGLSATNMTRLLFRAANIQWSGKSGNEAVPVDYFEMKTGGATVASGVQVLAITRRGNIKGTPSANFPWLTLTGFSSTGSDTSGMIDLAGTWNTSGVITAIKLNLTNTAAGAGSALFDLQISSASQFKIGTTGKVTAYNAVATVSNGVPSELATIDSPGLTANVAASTLYAVPASGEGLYRVSAYLVTTTAASVSSTMPNAQVVYTDKDSNTAVTLDVSPILGAAGLGQSGTLAANTVGTVFSGTVVIYVKASTTIQYQTINYASTIAGMAYALRMKLEAL